MGSLNEWLSTTERRTHCKSTANVAAHQVIHTTNFDIKFEPETGLQKRRKNLFFELKIHRASGR